MKRNTFSEYLGVYLGGHFLVIDMAYIAQLIMGHGFNLEHFLIGTFWYTVGFPIAMYLLKRVETR